MALFAIQAPQPRITDKLFDTFLQKVTALLKPCQPADYNCLEPRRLIQSPFTLPSQAYKALQADQHRGTWPGFDLIAENRIHADWQDVNEAVNRLLHQVLVWYVDLETNCLPVISSLEDSSGVRLSF